MKATNDLTTKVSSDGYNKTQLNVIEDMQRHVFHRDRLAHFFRWAHVMRAMRQGYRVLDLGCGSGNLAIMLYANRFDTKYVGVDIRGKTMDTAQSYFEGKKFRAQFIIGDLCADGWQDLALKNLGDNDEPTYPHVITSFEFIEHIPGDQVEPFLLRAKQCMGRETAFYLSTPCFDGVRKAENHVKEWFYGELKELLEKHFVIEKHWGTFMSQKDFEDCIADDSPRNQAMWEVWAKLKEYYGSETLAILFASMFPDRSRNCIWKLRLKGDS